MFGGGLGDRLETVSNVSRSVVIGKSSWLSADLKRRRWLAVKIFFQRFD
jgi:hypothetical protein